MARPSHTESDLRQTAIDEYFASCHKAAVIGGEEQGHSSRFVRVAYAFQWCLTGKTGKKSFLHSRPRQSIEKTWRCCSPRREHIDPDACTLQVQRPASSKIPDRGLRCAVHAEGGRSHRTCSRSRQYDGAARPHQRKRLLHRKQGSLDVHIENLVELLLADCGQRTHPTYSCVGEQNVQMSLLCLHDCEQPVEVIQIRYVALNPRNPGAQGHYCLVQLILTPASDEDVCTLRYKPLRGRQADAAIAACNDGNLSCESSHISDPFVIILI